VLDRHTHPSSTCAVALSCRPVALCTVIQPVPLVQVQQDAEGRLMGFSTAPPSRQQWQAMAAASGWSKGGCGCRVVRESLPPSAATHADTPR
jgi:hypothetical protein